MEIDKDKIDEATLALMYLVSFSEGCGEFAGMRAWKGFDWETLDRLYQKGLISNPKGKTKSVSFAREGYEQAEEAFERLFGVTK